MLDTIEIMKNCSCEGALIYIQDHRNLKPCTLITEMHVHTKNVTHEGFLTRLAERY